MARMENLLWPTDGPPEHAERVNIFAEMPESFFMWKFWYRIV